MDKCKYIASSIFSFKVSVLESILCTHTVYEKVEYIHVLFYLFLFFNLGITINQDTTCFIRAYGVVLRHY